MNLKGDFRQLQGASTAERRSVGFRHRPPFLIRQMDAIPVAPFRRPVRYGNAFFHVCDPGRLRVFFYGRNGGVCRGVLENLMPSKIEQGRYAVIAPQMLAKSLAGITRHPAAGRNECHLAPAFQKPETHIEKEQV